MTRFYRDIFCSHGGHVILDLLRLYCRYFCCLATQPPSTVNVFSPPTFLPSPFVNPPKRFYSNRFNRTHHSLLSQGHILPSRGPRLPPPAPLVLQVLVPQRVIDWGEGLGVLGLPAPLSHVFLSCFVDFYLDYIPLFFSSHVAFSIPSLTLFLLPSSFVLSFRPHLGLEFVLALNLFLVLFLVFIRFCCHKQRCL
jgi:hypothetical protein